MVAVSAVMMFAGCEAVQQEAGGYCSSNDECVGDLTCRGNICAEGLPGSICFGDATCDYYCSPVTQIPLCTNGENRSRCATDDHCKGELVCGVNHARGWRECGLPAGSACTADWQCAGDRVICAGTDGNMRCAESFGGFNHPCSRNGHCFSSLNSPQICGNDGECGIAEGAFCQWLADDRSSYCAGGLECVLTIDTERNVTISSCQPIGDGLLGSVCLTNDHCDDPLLCRSRTPNTCALPSGSPCNTTNPPTTNYSCASYVCNPVVVGGVVAGNLGTCM